MRGHLHKDLLRLLSLALFPLSLLFSVLSRPETLEHPDYRLVLQLYMYMYVAGQDIHPSFHPKILLLLLTRSFLLIGWVFNCPFINFLARYDFYRLGPSVISESSR